MSLPKHPLIKESGWRWRTMQWVFKLLYRYDYMYFSPWKSGGFAAAVVLFYDGKILLCQRAAHLMDPHDWCCPGGYLDVAKRETFAQAAAREVFEEFHITIDPKELTDDKLCCFAITHGRNMSTEIADYTNTCTYYAYTLSDEQFNQRQESDEAYNLTLFKEKEFEELVQKGKISAEDTKKGIRAAFQFYKQQGKTKP